MNPVLIAVLFAALFAVMSILTMAVAGFHRFSGARPRALRWGRVSIGLAIVALAWMFGVAVLLLGVFPAGADL